MEIEDYTYDDPQILSNRHNTLKKRCDQPRDQADEILESLDDEEYGGIRKSKIQEKDN